MTIHAMALIGGGLGISPNRPPNPRNPRGWWRFWRGCSRFRDRSLIRQGSRGKALCDQQISAISEFMNIIRRPNAISRFERHEEFIVFIIEKRKICKLPLNGFFYILRYLNILSIREYAVRR